MERLGRFSAVAQRATGSRVYVLAVGYAAAAIVVAANGLAWAAHCHNIDHLIVAVAESYAVIHVLSVLISAAHLLGFVFKFNMRMYFKFIYGRAAKKAPSSTVMTLVYIVIGGPGFTALALLGPLIDGEELEPTKEERRAARKARKTEAQQKEAADPAAKGAKPAAKSDKPPAPAEEDPPSDPERGDSSDDEE